MQETGEKTNKANKGISMEDFMNESNNAFENMGELFTPELKTHSKSKSVGSYDKSGYLKCKRCRKVFYVQAFQRAHWHYKDDNNNWYCNWTCYNRAINNNAIEK